MPSKNQIIELNKDYEDALFRLIVNSAAEEEGKLLLAENEHLNSGEDGLPSVESIRTFSRLLDAHLKKKKKAGKSALLSGLIKVAVTVFTLAAVFSALMLTVEAFRVEVLNFLISIESEYTLFKLGYDDQEAEKLIVDWKNAYVPTYIPEGYNVSDVSYSDTAKKITLENKADGSFIIYTQSESGSISIDTENASLIEMIKINNEDGTLSVKDSIATLVWKMDNSIFIVQGKISKDEAIKIAENVKFIN